MASTGRRRSFTARLDDQTHDRFARVTRAMSDRFAVTRSSGTGTAAPRLYPVDQAAVLRALLAMADTDPDVVERLRTHLAADPAVVDRDAS